MAATGFGMSNVSSNFGTRGSDTISGQSEAGLLRPSDVCDSLGCHSTLSSRFRGYFSTYPTRFRSFKNWPRFHGGPRPADLALAGFYYVGAGDQARCFYCHVLVKNWEKYDSAIEEHKKWSRDCLYLRYITDKE